MLASTKFQSVNRRLTPFFSESSFVWPQRTVSFGTSVVSFSVSVQFLFCVNDELEYTQVPKRPESLIPFILTFSVLTSRQLLVHLHILPATPCFSNLRSQASLYPLLKADERSEHWDYNIIFFSRNAFSIAWVANVHQNDLQ